MRKIYSSQSPYSSLIDGSLSLSDFPYDEIEEAEVNNDVEAALLLLAEMEEKDLKREGLRITEETNTPESHKEPVISPSALTVTTDNRTGLEKHCESPAAAAVASSSLTVAPLNSHAQDAEDLDIQRAFDILAEMERNERSHGDEDTRTGSILAVTHDLNIMASNTPNSIVVEKKRMSSPIKFKSVPPSITSFSEVIDCDLDEDALRALQIFAEMESKENEADAKRALEILAELEEEEKRRNGFSEEGTFDRTLNKIPSVPYSGNTSEPIKQEVTGKCIINEDEDFEFKNPCTSPSKRNKIDAPIVLHLSKMEESIPTNKLEVTHLQNIPLLDNHDNSIQEVESFAEKENLNSINITARHSTDIKYSREVPITTYSGEPKGESRQDIQTLAHIENISLTPTGARGIKTPRNLVSSHEDGNYDEFQQALKLLSDMENDAEARYALEALGQMQKEKGASLPNDEAESNKALQLSEWKEPTEDEQKALQILASMENLTMIPPDETALNVSRENAICSEEAENASELHEALRFLSNMENTDNAEYGLEELAQLEQVNGSLSPYDEAEKQNAKQTVVVVSHPVKPYDNNLFSDGAENDTELHQALRLLSNMENDEETQHALEVLAQLEREQGTSLSNDEVEYETSKQYVEAAELVPHSEAPTDDNTQQAFDIENLTIPRYEVDLNNTTGAVLSDEVESSSEVYQALKFLSKMESDDETHYALEVLAQIEEKKDTSSSKEKVERNKNSMQTMTIASDIEAPSDDARRALEILADIEEPSMTPRSETPRSQLKKDYEAVHALKILAQLEGKRDIISPTNEEITHRPSAYVAPSISYSDKDNADADADADLALQILAEMERREKQLTIANPSSMNSYFQNDMQVPLINNISPAMGRDIEEIIKQVNNIVVSDLTRNSRERFMISETSTSQRHTHIDDVKVQSSELAVQGTFDTCEALENDVNKEDNTPNPSTRSKHLLSETTLNNPPTIVTSYKVSDIAPITGEHNNASFDDNNSMCNSTVVSSHDDGKPGSNSLQSNSARTTNCLSIGKLNGVTFHSPFNLPDNPPKPRAENEILSTYSKPPEPTNITWLQATQSVIELINAVRGASASRRCNACGTFKMLTLNDKNKISLARTKGVLDAFRFAVELKPSPSCQYSMCSRIRILSAIYNLSTRAENRDLIIQSNLLPGLVHAAKDHNSEGRLISCSTLALLAKNEGNQLYMVSTPGLITALSEVLGATAVGMVPVQKAHTIEEEATDDDSEERYSEEDTCSSSGSVTDETCESSDVSVTDDKYVVACKSTQEEASLFVTPSRVSACAALIHLSKDCACIAQMCKSSKLLNCLTNVCVEQDFEARTKSIEVLCNLTRYPWNQKILASNECLMRSLIKCLKSTSVDDRKWAARALQNICSDQSSKISIARQPLLSALGLSALSTEAEEQHAAVAALLNLSCEPGVVTAMSNTRNVVSTLIHLTYDNSTSAEVRLMACDALASIGLWLQTVAASANVPDGMEANLPRSITSGWERYD